MLRPKILDSSSLPLGPSSLPLTLTFSPSTKPVGTTLKCIQNPAISHWPHCYHPGPNCYHFFLDYCSNLWTGLVPSAVCSEFCDQYESFKSKPDRVALPSPPVVSHLTQSKSPGPPDLQPARHYAICWPHATLSSLTLFPTVISFPQFTPATQAFFLPYFQNMAELFAWNLLYFSFLSQRFCVSVLPTSFLVPCQECGTMCYHIMKILRQLPREINMERKRDLLPITTINCQSCESVSIEPLGICSPNQLYQIFHPQKG